MGKLEKNQKQACAIYIAIFAFLAVLNMLSPYIGDDFRYLFSFYDYERIESFSQIILSMRAHRYSMNGRLLVHILVQFFGMLPTWLFDLVNAGVFVVQMALIHKIARDRMSQYSGMLIVIFCGIWLFCPVFGQIFLWQDGACNYLWPIVLSLLFLWLYMEYYLYDRAPKTVLGKVTFLGLSVCMGACTETASAAAVFMAALLLGLKVLETRKRCSWLMIGAVAAGFLGYVSIYTAPAQLRQKSAEMSLSGLLSNAANIAVKYWEMFGIVLCVFVVLLILNLKWKTDAKRIYLALVFLAGSLAAHLILIFAQFYVARSSASAAVFLLTADMILLYPVTERVKNKKFVAGFAAVLLLMTMPSLVIGFSDIYDTNTRIKENEAYIYECRDQGMMDIEVPIVYSKTSYSVADNGRYLKDDPTTWPNEAMAVYYEIHSLTGY